MDWGDVLKALGYVIVGVLGAVATLLVRVVPVRTKAQIDREAAAARIEKDRVAAERKGKREIVDEYQELADMHRRDAEAWRQQVHAVRNENAVLAARVEVQRLHQEQLERRTKECEEDRRELWDVLEENGITRDTHARRPGRRSGPVVPYAPDAPDAPETDAGL